MTLHRTRRAGLSRVEVLVAMFIMALGMIALLTLFPLGALQMGQALKDDPLTVFGNGTQTRISEGEKQNENSGFEQTSSFWSRHCLTGINRFYWLRRWDCGSSIRASYRRSCKG
jgi:Tfp pilus assembly protein PilV